MVRSTKKSTNEVETTQNANKTQTVTNDVHVVEQEVQTSVDQQKTKRTKKNKEVVQQEPQQEVTKETNVIEQQLSSSTTENNETMNSDNVELENQIIVEQSVEFHAKLQQLGLLVSSLKSEFKQLEKKFQKDLKLAQKSSNKKKRKVGNRAPSGFVKPARISDELAIFLDKPVGTEMARTAVTKDINAYIRANNLQDKTNGRKIIPDKKLASLLKISPNDDLTYFNLQRYMSSHFAKSTKNTENVVTSNVTV